MTEDERVGTRPHVIRDLLMPRHLLVWQYEVHTYNTDLCTKHEI